MRFWIVTDAGVERTVCTLRVHVCMQVTPEDVSAVLGHWGPNLAALSSKPEALAGPPMANGGAPSNALVLAGDAQRGHAAAAAGAFGGLDPAAARRLARQCAAKAASVLLGQLSKQLNLVEQCLVVVLLHLVQVSRRVYWFEDWGLVGRRGAVAAAAQAL
jgi:hypothetical protein